MLTLNNLSKNLFVFQIGAHPAFNLHAFDGLSLEEYFLIFSEKENNLRYLIHCKVKKL